MPGSAEQANSLIASRWQRDKGGAGLSSKEKPSSVERQAADGKDLHSYLKSNNYFERKRGTAVINSQEKFRASLGVDIEKGGERLGTQIELENSSRRESIIFKSSGALPFKARPITASQNKQESDQVVDNQVQASDLDAGTAFEEGSQPRASSNIGGIYSKEQVTENMDTDRQTNFTWMQRRIQSSSGPRAQRIAGQQMGRTSSDFRGEQLSTLGKKEAVVVRRSDIDYFSSLQTKASNLKYQQDTDALSSHKTFE